VPADFSSYLVTDGETSSGNKFDNLVNAAQAALNAIGDLSRMAFASGLIFDPAQLMQKGAVNGQTLHWSSASGTWVPGSLCYWKVTEKDVLNTTTKTDLLNGEITIAANALPTNGSIRVWAAGDYLNNRGGSAHLTEIELKLGGQVIWAAGDHMDNFTSSANRRGWVFQAVIEALGATNKQRGSGTIAVSDESAATTGVGTLRSFNAASNSFHGAFLGVETSVDMTAAQTLTLSISHSNADPNVSMRLEHAQIEVTV
jgi:hypothetical protein